MRKCKCGWNNVKHEMKVLIPYKIRSELDLSKEFFNLAKLTFLRKKLEKYK